MKLAYLAMAIFFTGMGLSGATPVLILGGIYFYAFFTYDANERKKEEKRKCWLQNREREDKEKARIAKIRYDEGMAEIEKTKQERLQKKTYTQFGNSKKKNAYQQPSPKIEAKQTVNIEIYEKDSKPNITELADYMIKALPTTGTYRVNSKMPTLQQAKSKIERIVNSNPSIASDGIKRKIDSLVNRFITSGIFIESSRLPTKYTYSCISCGNKFYTTKLAHGSTPCPHCLKEYIHRIVNPRS